MLAMQDDGLRPRAFNNATLVKQADAASSIPDRPTLWKRNMNMKNYFEMYMILFGGLSAILGVSVAALAYYKKLPQWATTPLALGLGTTLASYPLILVGYFVAFFHMPRC